MKTAVVMLSLLLTASCGSIYRAKAPIPTGTFSIPYLNDLSQPNLITAYDAMPEGTAKVARRNQIIFEILFLTDALYSSYESRFFSGQAYASTASDMIVLGSSAAGAVTGAAATKAILAVVSGSVTGLHASYEKNFFDQATRESVVQVMRADRLAVRAMIEAGMATNKYSLEQGLMDTTDYYNAGTIVGALISISNTASQNSTGARETLKQIRRAQ